MRRRLPAKTIAAMERRACEVGVTADRVLITSGLLTEDAYVRALALNLGLTFEPLETPPDGDCLVSEERLIDASAAGLLPLVGNDETVIVVAPRGGAARRLCTIANSSAEWRRRLRLTTNERLTRFIRRNASDALGQRAAFALLNDRPDLSASPRDIPWSRWRGILAAVALGAGIAAPNLVATGASIVLSALFIAWIALRVVGLLAALQARPALPRRSDTSLPVYTIIAALYREAAAVGQLIAALDALDWPGVMAQTPQASDTAAPTFGPWPKAPPLPR